MLGMRRGAMAPIGSTTMLSIVLLLAALAAPTSGASPGPGPSGASNGDTIKESIDALRQLDSYQYWWQQRQGADRARVSTVEGTVVTAPEWRMRTDQLVDGEVSVSIVTVGDGAWLSYAGSGYLEAGDAAQLPGFQLPYEQVIREMVDTGSPVQDLGIETIDGAPARHLRTVVDAPDPSLLPSNVGDFDAIDGVLDVWIAEDGGHLVRSTFEGARVTPASGSDQVRRMLLSETLDVSHVDDPANVIETPSTGLYSPPPVASPDATVVALVEGAYGGLARLGSFRAHIDTGSNGLAVTYDITVQNEPVEAAQMTLGVGTDFAIRVLLVDGQAWIRDAPDAPWQATDPANAPGCSNEDGVSEPCTFEGIAAIVSTSKVPVGSFVRLEDEVSDGVTLLHLRSDAGQTVPRFGWIPGTTDIWTDPDTGLLLRETFDGEGYSSTMIISDVDAPTNRVEVPPGS